eukprot:CAMPEP_0114231762 /NCGR_PEP_ID=MMETSP0058-20121206/4230_1 /TAXON_ID=36894 /ORGANISM="Pyramimonas parkeae, CCMP726" /LENGTH=305 /DNA_ID=CAMNT_0001343159 /DNA_START=202 /DNA_END=1120 /DNA_ORIENTATION=-
MRSDPFGQQTVTRKSISFTTRSTLGSRPTPSQRKCDRCLSARAGSSDLEDAGDSRTFSDVCEQILRSFYEACIPQLGVRYDEALREFAAACKEAYVSGATVSQVSLQLQMSPNTGNAELDALLASRGGLRADEVELRRGWVTCCFVAFDEAAVLREQVPEDVDVGVDDPRLAVFVRNVVRMAKQGMDAQRVKLTEVLAMSDPDSAPRSDVESAVLSQAIRIVFCALDAAGGRTIPPQSPPETHTPRAKPSSSAVDTTPRGAKFAARKAKAAAEKAAKEQSEKEGKDVPSHLGYLQRPQMCMMITL